MENIVSCFFKRHLQKKSYSSFPFPPEENQPIIKKI